MAIAMRLRLVTVRASRRSKYSGRVLDVLVDGGRMTVPELARAAGVRLDRVEGILFGALPYYRPASSFVALGIVLRHHGPHGIEVEATALGVAEGRMLRAAREAGRVL